ncbi:insulin-like peptide INSL6 isoform X1 [Pan paniscus]|uniref:insulin-like peptide INSL6 isoform X1 n=1 Tax=Pan paniscus TaxID=9597 RepID=UPI003003CF5F
MPRLLRLCLLWLGLLLVRFSRELSDISSARKLCGRYLVKEIEKLCGHVNWSQFRFEEETPFSRLIAQASEKVEAYGPYQLESPQTAFPARGRGTNPALVTSRQLKTKKPEPLVLRDCVVLCQVSGSCTSLYSHCTKMSLGQKFWIRQDDLSHRLPTGLGPSQLHVLLAGCQVHHQTGDCGQLADEQVEGAGPAQVGAHPLRVRICTLLGTVLKGVTLIGDLAGVGVVGQPALLGECELALCGGQLILQHGRGDGPVHIHDLPILQPGDADGTWVYPEMRHRNWMVRGKCPLPSQEDCKIFTVGRVKSLE